jgi:hypothetical protein
MKTTRVIVVATWIAALAAWAVYERTLRETPPPPPPPPPLPAPCASAHHGAITEIVQLQIAEGRRLLWAHAFRSTVYSEQHSPDLCAVATEDAAESDHRLDVYRIGETCPTCGGRAWRILSTVDYSGNLIQPASRIDDLNHDGRTDLLVSLAYAGWDVFTVGADTLIQLDPTIDGTDSDFPKDVDGDGIAELVYTNRHLLTTRFLVWDPEKHHYSEEHAVPLYEREMEEIQRRTDPCENDARLFIFYATLLGRADDAWEVARPWIIVAGLDEHALRDQLEVAYAGLTLYRP